MSEPHGFSCSLSHFASSRDEAFLNFIQPRKVDVGVAKTFRNCFAATTLRSSRELVNVVLRASCRRNNGDGRQQREKTCAHGVCGL